MILAKRIMATVIVGLGGLVLITAFIALNYRLSLSPLTNLSQADVQTYAYLVDIMQYSLGGATMLMIVAGIYLLMEMIWHA